MKTQYHVIITFPLLLLVSYAGWQFILWLFLANAFADSDHVLNFWISRKKIDLNLKRIYKLHVDNVYELKKMVKAYFPFHSFEIILVLPIVAHFLNLTTIGLAISLGLLYHLIIDVLWLGNTIFEGDYIQTILYYWFVYRLKKSFNINKLFKRES